MFNSVKWFCHRVAMKIERFREERQRARMKAYVPKSGPRFKVTYPSEERLSVRNCQIWKNDTEK